MKSVLLSCCLVLLGVAAILSAPIRPPSKYPRRRPETKEETQSYLRRFGWNRRNDETDDDLVDTLTRFQKFFDLPVTGKADNETLDLMATPRCGTPDTNVTSSRRKRYVVYGTKWRDLILTYLIQNFHPNLTVDSQYSAFQRAFQDWKDAAPLLSFTEVKTIAAKLKLSFQRLDHGDGSPFDGPGKTLAHAFFPPTGLIHFDSDEQWTTDQPCSSKINLRQVATHELGHALGLQHSNVKTAVMFPYYRCMNNFALDRDDILGIQALYGASSRYSSISTSTSRPTSSTTRTTTRSFSTPSTTSSINRPTSTTTRTTTRSFSAPYTARASTPWATTTTTRRRPCRGWWWRC